MISARAIVMLSALATALLASACAEPWRPRWAVPAAAPATEAAPAGPPVIAAPQAPPPATAPKPPPVKAARLEAPETPREAPETPREAPETPPIEATRLEAPETPPEAPATPPVNDDPSQVMGLDGPALEALLGRPGFVRAEPPAQVWQYRGKDCVLDVFLYTGAGGPSHRVTYYEVRGGTGDPAARRRCFRALLEARGPKARGPA